MFENGFVVLSNHFLSTIIPAQSEHLTTKQQEYRQSTHSDSNSKEPQCVLTSSPSSYGLRIPWTPLCLPCSPCTGRTAPRCTGSTPAPEPAPHHQPPPSRRQRVKRPTCHKALPSDTHMSLWEGMVACDAGRHVCVWRRCVRADGWKRTELCTALRLRAVYVHFDNSLYTAQLPLHGALSLSPPTPS